MSDLPAVIVINREKLEEMLRNYTADQWNAAADHVEDSVVYTKQALADSLRNVAEKVREG